MGRICDPGVTRRALTGSAIEALQPGQELRDDKVPGLSVRATASGKSFMLRYRTKAGKTRRPKIGEYGITTLAQARQHATAMLAQVMAGIDPMAMRQVEKCEPTMHVLWDRAWHAHYVQKTWGIGARRIWLHHIAPRVGARKVRELGYEEAAALHRALAQAPVQANRMLAVLSKVLNLAERYGMRDIGTNPCRHVPRFKERSRKRFAKAEELLRIGAIFDRELLENRASATFLALMIFTGMRPGEIAAARREWIERNEGFAILRLPDSKTGQRDVYLPPQAVALLDALPVADGTLTGIQSPRGLWRRIRTEAGCPDLRLYDLRRTFATVGLAAGNSISLMGELLGHKTAQTTKVYARLMEGAARDSVLATAEKMQALLGG